jgi:CRP-like cAMP-binding protein
MRGTRTACTDRIAAIPLFAGCSRRELEAIDRASTEMSFPAGHVLCREGEPGRELMLVLEGSARVEKQGQAVATLGPGEFVGELSLLDLGPRTASVVADGAMRALVLTPSELSTLLADVRPLAGRMLASLATRLRRTDEAAYHF